MGNKKRHGTTSATPTQVGEILREVIKAVTTVLDKFSASELINALKGNGEKLAGIMALVFTALINNQGILLEAQPKPSFSAWLTVKLGTFQNVELLIDSIKKAGCDIGRWALDIMGKTAFKISEVETEIELVQVSVADFGFKNGAKIKDIFAKAIEYGLMLCPNEVGPQLRLQYTDQSRGEWLIVAMEAISGSDSRLRLFFVSCHGDGGMWLSTGYGGPDCVYDPDVVFVFARARK